MTRPLDYFCIEEWKDGSHPIKGVAFCINQHYNDDQWDKVFCADINNEDGTNRRIIWAEGSGPFLMSDIFRRGDNDRHDDEYWDEEITPDRTFIRQKISLLIEDNDTETEDKIYEYYEYIRKLETE